MRVCVLVARSGLSAFVARAAAHLCGELTRTRGTGGQDEPVDLVLTLACVLRVDSILMACVSLNNSRALALNSRAGWRGLAKQQGAEGEDDEHGETVD